MNPEGFVQIHRCMLDWEWYQDDRCVRLLLHLHLKANYRPGKWKGNDVNPGQLVTSSATLAEQLGWSRSAVIRTLEKLKESKEVDTKPDTKWTLVTLIKWDKFQVAGTKSDSKSRRNRTTTGQQPDTIEEGEERNNTPSGVPTVFVWPKWAGPNTLAKWEEFKAHKLAHHRFQYKTAASEQAAIDLLAKYYTSGKTCVAALGEAMAKGHMFPVDPAEKRQPTQQQAPTTPGTKHYRQ